MFLYTPLHHRSERLHRLRSRCSELARPPRPSGPSLNPEPSPPQLLLLPCRHPRRSFPVKGIKLLLLRRELKLYFLLWSCALRQASVEALSATDGTVQNRSVPIANNHTTVRFALFPAQASMPIKIRAMFSPSSTLEKTRWTNRMCHTPKLPSDDGSHHDIGSLARLVVKSSTR